MRSRVARSLRPVRDDIQTQAQDDYAPARILLWMWLVSEIRGSPVVDPEHQYDLFVWEQLVQDSVVSDSESVRVFLSA